MAPPNLTADELEALAAVCISEHDFQGVMHCIRLLVVVDPRRASRLYDTIEDGISLSRALRSS